MSKKLGDISFITKLAGFEHTEYIQDSCSHTKVNEDDVPLFIGRTIRDGKIDTHFDWYIPLKLSQLLERSQLRKKCLVLPYVGTLGDLAIFDGHYAAHLGSNVAKIELNDNCGYSEEFIYYFLKSPYGQKLLLRDMQGGLQKNITMGAIRDVELPDLSVDDQKCITNVLSLIDHQIENNNAICAELEAMAKLLYDYWFVQFDFPDENGRPYKSSGGKMVWNEELKREIPEGWMSGTFEDFIKIGNGKDHQSLRAGTIPVYGSGGIMRYADKALYEGESVLMPRKGTLNNIMYVNGPFWTVDTMYYSVMKKPNSAIYMFYSAKLYDYERLNTGTGVPSMTASLLYSLKVVVPPQDILCRYDKAVKAFYDAIHKGEQENMELASLRDFLLPLLMNGQVTFKEADCH